MKRLTHEDVISHDPTSAVLLTLANINIDKCNDYENGKIHQPVFHESGWTISAQTQKGPVSLWFCWLNDQLRLCFPKEIPFIDIEKEFNARHITHYYQTTNGVKIYQTYDRCPYGQHPSFILDDYSIKEEYQGHDKSGTIATLEFDNEFGKVPELRDKFLNLFCKMAKQATHINIEYGFVFPPEPLSKLGYTNIEYPLGKEYVSFGGTLVFARKGKEIICLRSGNSIVPWVCIRRVPVSKVNTNQILDLLVF